MPTPICLACRVEMRCARNNRLVRDPETASFPSTYWLGDEWQCPGCGARIVTGFGRAIQAPPNYAAGEVVEFRYALPAEVKA